MRKLFLTLLLLLPASSFSDELTKELNGLDITYQYEGAGIIIKGKKVIEHFHQAKIEKVVRQ